MSTGITLPARGHAQPTAPRVRAGLRLSAAAVPLLALAALAGLLAPEVYRRNPATLIPALRGQDLVTLLALPALSTALHRARQGSARATLLLIGLLGYMFYTYTGAALAYAFDALTPLYIALFSLTLFAIVLLATGVDAAALAGAFDEATPRRAAAAFLALIGLLLALLELGQIAGYLATGDLPAGVVAAGGGAYFVYGLDLGLVLPLSLLGAAWIVRRRPWGFVLASCILAKATTMGLALLAMNWFMLRAGLPPDAADLLGFYTLLAAGGLAMSLWFFRHCRG